MLDDASGRRDARGRPEALLAGFALLVALTLALIVLGALVRAHGAGLACPDWPRCFGEWVPVMDLEIAFEWSHRALAGGVTLLFGTLGLTLWRRTLPGDRLRRALLLATALLAVQILLGALTVWKLLASWTVTSHLLTGSSIAVCLLWIALELRDRARAVPAPPAPSPLARRWLAGVLALLVVQIALGGLVSSRYAGLACPAWPTCNGGLWFPTWAGPVGLHLLHRTNGYLLLAALLAWAALARGPGRLASLARAAAALGAAQVVVGVANVLTGIPVEVTALHSALAAALVLTAAAAAREAWGRPRLC